MAYRGRWFFGLTLALPLAVLGVNAIGMRYGLRVNLTYSLPRGIYQIDPQSKVERDSLVMVCSPVVLPQIARGICSNGTMPLLKIVKGIEGDTVTLDKNGVTINGHYLERSAQIPGVRDFPYVSDGTYKIDGLWLYTPVSDSIDSRYYGPVARANVLATMHPFLLF